LDFGKAIVSYLAH